METAERALKANGFSVLRDVDPAQTPRIGSHYEYTSIEEGHAYHRRRVG